MSTIEIEPEVTHEDITSLIESILDQADNTLEEQKIDYDIEHPDGPMSDRWDALLKIEGVLQSIEDIRAVL